MLHRAHPWAYYAGIYALLQICSLISLLCLAITILIVSVRRAGANLHRDALRTLIRAPLRFFTTTDTGVVTNLFSQDLNLIDTELPTALLNTLSCVSPVAMTLLLVFAELLGKEIVQSDTEFPGFPSNRTSDRYAYLFSVLGHKLPVPQRPAIYGAKVLSADFQAAKVARP